MKKVFRNQKGFTLVEIIAVLILLGILAAVAVPKYIDLTTQAESRAMDAGVAELNGRESLAWGQAKLDPAGWGGTGFTDADIMANATTTLGPDYTIDTPTVTGCNLTFGSITEALTRTASTTTAPGRWARP